MKIIITLLIASGVILIYDARKIANKRFSFGDQNEAVLGLKICGFIITVIGSIIIMCL